MPISEATVFKNYKHASARRLKIVKTFYSRRAELLISEVVNLFLVNLVFANLSPHTTPNGIKYMLYMVNKALSTDRRIRYIQLLRAFFLAIKNIKKWGEVGYTGNRQIWATNIFGFDVQATFFLLGLLEFASPALR